MLNTVTSRNILPHTLINNQQTHYDSVRLLKGDPPGRYEVNHYRSELGIMKNSKDFSDQCIDNHLRDVNDGLFTQDNHGGHGGITADQKFYDPKKVKEYTSAIRFKNPQRHIPCNI